MDFCRLEENVQVNIFGTKQSRKEISESKTKWKLFGTLAHGSTEGVNTVPCF